MIPKKDGGQRRLGIPTVTDRVAQTVAKMVLEPIFDPDSFGYRPGRSALDAVALVRRRCWKSDWVVEFDIKGLFDNIDQALLLRALEWNCKVPWVVMYAKRWMTAPLLEEDGSLVPRTRGTPQGGVISPLLSNLFLHYVLDAWMRRSLRSVQFARYADDAVVHCKSEAQAKTATHPPSCGHRPSATRRSRSIRSRGYAASSSTSANRCRRAGSPAHSVRDCPAAAHG